MMRRLLLSLCLLVATSSSAESLADWQERWTEERGNVLRRYEERIATEGLKVIYAELQREVQSIPATTDEESRWKLSFSCAMRANLQTDALVESIDSALDASVEDELSIDTRSALQRAADSDAHFRGEPFQAGELRDGRQVLLANGNALLDAQCPEHEISIEPSSESETAQQLFRIADITSSALQIERLPLMDATAAAIHRSRSRWDAFFTNAMLDQFPWETYANELSKHWMPPLRGTLSQPPASQVRLAHPTPVVVYNDKGTTFEPSLAVEAIGWRTYDPERYEPRWGVSGVAVLKSASDTSTGYGLLLTARSASIGIIVRDTASESNDVQFMLGVDIAKLFHNSSSTRTSRAAALNAVFDSLERCPTQECESD